MQPDFIWMKSRSTTYGNNLYDAVRGGTKMLTSNTTAAEVTVTGGVTSFNSDGMTIQNDATNSNINASATTYVGWQWKEGATQGFDIVTYTGTGTNRTVAHNLGVAPAMMIFKNRSSAVEWQVYHASIGNTQYGVLNTTAAFATSGIWQNTSPTSSVFSIGNFSGVNTNGSNYVAYLFPGFSKFGSYTGNGSADGPFVFLGFRPRWFLVKVASGTTGFWHLIDTSRSTYNQMGLGLYPNSSNAESSDFASDILSNGLKIRNTQIEINQSGATYIYAAFAENPFKYSLAR
jgi:hypothetical protein